MGSAFQASREPRRPYDLHFCRHDRTAFLAPFPARRPWTKACLVASRFR